MLYANEMKYSRLTDACKAFGIPEESILIGIEFMESSKETDYSMLESIKPAELGKNIDWKLHNDIIKAVKKEILSEHDRELADRYYNWAFAAAGVDCIWIVYDNLYGNTNECSKRLESALAKRFGAEKAKAAVYACEVSRASNEELRYGSAAVKSAKMCMEAVDFLGDKPDTVTLLTLCIFTLNTSDPAKDMTDEVKKSLDIVLGTAKTISALSPKAKTFLLSALGEAAYFSDKAKKLFFAEAKLANQVAENTADLNVNSNRILDLAETEPKLLDPNYIVLVAKHSNIPERKKRLRNLAVTRNQLFKDTITCVNDSTLAVYLENILVEADSSYDRSELDLRAKVRSKIIRSICINTKQPQMIRAFLEGTGSFESMLPDCQSINTSNREISSSYYQSFGADDFFNRLITVLMLCDYQFGRNYRIRDMCGLRISSETIDIAMNAMLDSGAPLDIIINSVALCIDDMYSDKENNALKAVEFACSDQNRLAELDPKELCATGRTIYADAICRQTMRNKDKVIKLAEDSSKAVKAKLVGHLSHSNNTEIVSTLLKAKKQNQRELALQIIEKVGADEYKDILQEIYQSEKSDKLKVRIGALLGEKVEVAEKKSESISNIVKKLSKNTAKLSWLFAYPFKPVRMADGSEAEKEYITALFMSYLPLTSATRSPVGDTLAEGLNKTDLEELAVEVFTRWCDNGSQAKQKWVLYFCSVYGGSRIVREIIHSIKQWAENMRGAIAADAVRALALGGSSEALMAIDAMSRKFKNKQVRSAAADTLTNAAEQLGITTEELADRIVPDLGFDENLCRVFDYGDRKFEVYLRPTLDLEILCGEKTLKTLPKPGAKDDPEKAPDAFAAFKEMKKQIKTAVTAQRARLEYVMICDRRWSVEGWKTLFVGNALMHCFAIGLIWGIYEGSSLVSTFRYMEDGSFTTSDGDDFELPENAMIGLVHPIELTDEQRSEWLEQLSDYEITQPFPQLERKVYKPNDSELNQTIITRFSGTDVNSITLVNRMTKFGWDKGTAEDAGVFYYFVRSDITRRTRRPDGTFELEGNCALLVFSGTYIAIYDYDGEDVTIDKLGFSKPGTLPNYYDDKEMGFLPVSEVSPRYFSEILLQLSDIFTAAGSDGQ